MLPPNGDQTEHGGRRTPLGHRPPAEEEEGAEQPAQGTGAGAQADLSSHCVGSGTCISSQELTLPGGAGLQENTFLLPLERSCLYDRGCQFTSALCVRGVSDQNPKPRRNPWKWRSGNLQKLASLGEAHCVVASSQVRVLRELAAHLCHLIVHVHEEAVLHVLMEQLG